MGSRARARARACTSSSSAPPSPSLVPRWQACYYDELILEGVEPSRARIAARDASRGLCGLAMWPRLVLRAAGQRAEGGPVEEEIVVDTRGPGSGGASFAPSETAWQTVLAVLDGRPVTVEAGQTLRARVAVELPRAVEEAVHYTVDFS